MGACNVILWIRNLINTLYSSGPEVCEPFLTLKAVQNRLLIIPKKSKKQILMSGFGGAHNARILKFEPTTF